MGIFASLVAIGAGYVLQDCSHFLTGESSFQSSYSAGGHIDMSNLATWSKLFTEHMYYLIPLCVDVTLPLLVPAKESLALLRAPLPVTFVALYQNLLVLLPLLIWAAGNYCLDSKNGINVFPGFPYFKRVLRCNLVANGNKEHHKEDLAAVRSWAMAKLPPHDMSSHWWFADLPSPERAAFDRCAKSVVIDEMFRSLFSRKHYCLEVVEGMNEVYVTGPSRMEQKFNSDQIFYTKHVDGPWGLIPFVSVYRCIVGMDRNHMTTTHYPMTKDSVNVCEGDVMGFDFNREVHYITRDESKRDISDEFRVVLKLHYCVYPRVLAPLGWLMHRLNVAYNQTFRALFLKTIDPQTLYEHFLAWNVVVNTTLFNNIEMFVGQRNVLYLLFALALWAVTGQYLVFLAMTSFVHYLRYIGTYYFRTGVDFGSFKRDVLLFKVLSLAQIFLHYLCPYVPLLADAMGYPRATHWDLASLGMIVSGYAVSVLATRALGVDRTYFGAELGLCEPKWITDFPYGYIPHPMIVSQVWALAGVHKALHFRTALPYLVPVHIALYSLHMLQEQFDVYERKPVPASEQKLKTN